MRRAVLFGITGMLCGCACTPVFALDWLLGNSETQADSGDRAMTEAQGETTETASEVTAQGEALADSLAAYQKVWTAMKAIDSLTCESLITISSDMSTMREENQITELEVTSQVQKMHSRDYETASSVKKILNDEKQNFDSYCLNNWQYVLYDDGDAWRQEYRTDSADDVLGLAGMVFQTQPSAMDTIVGYANEDGSYSFYFTIQADSIEDNFKQYLMSTTETDAVDAQMDITIDSNEFMVETDSDGIIRNGTVLINATDKILGYVIPVTVNCYFEFANIDQEMDIAFPQQRMLDTYPLKEETEKETQDPSAETENTVLVWDKAYDQYLTWEKENWQTATQAERREAVKAVAIAGVDQAVGLENLSDFGITETDLNLDDTVESLLQEAGNGFEDGAICSLQDLADIYASMVEEGLDLAE